MSDKACYWNGWWNGEPAKYRVVLVIVGEEPEDRRLHAETRMNGRKRYLWFVPFVGQERQVVEVVYEGSTFYLDNADGTGLMKVTKGMGSPQVGHSTVYPEEILHEVQDGWWTRYSEELVEQKRQAVLDGWMALDPEGYPKHLEEMKALQQLIDRRAR